MIDSTEIISNALSEYNRKKDNALIEQIIELTKSGDIQVTFMEDNLEFSNDNFLTISGAVQVSLPKYTQAIARIAELERQNEIMRKALEFYAKEMNYSVDDYMGISGEMRRRCILYTDCEERNDVYSYAGKRARQALKDVEGVG